MKYMFIFYILILTGLNCYAEESEAYKRYLEQHKNGVYTPDAKTGAWLQEEKRNTEKMIRQGEEADKRLYQNSGGYNGPTKNFAR